MWLIDRYSPLLLKKYARFVLFTLFLCVMHNSRAHLDDLLIAKKVTPKVSAQRQIENPKVRWLVMPFAQQYCRNASVKDGYAEIQEGCVYWVIRQQECTIVTTGHSSHALLGELFMYCLEGN